MQWEYADLWNAGSFDGIRFGNDQPAQLIDEAESFFGRGLKRKDCTARLLRLENKYFSPIDAWTFLGARGWEMVSGLHMPEAHAVQWVFKRPVS